MHDPARMRRFGLVAQLRDQPDAAETNERHHADIWPEVIADGRQAGVVRTAIFRDETTLFMVMDTDETFDIETFGSLPSDP